MSRNMGERQQRDADNFHGVAAPGGNGTLPSLRFFVPGIPEPKGSWKTFPGRGKRRRTVLVASNAEKLKPWVETIRLFARQAAGGYCHDGPVAYRFDFYFPRPKYHFTKTGKPSPQYTDIHAVKPDKDKLKRAVFDAMEKIVYTNDSRMCLDRGSGKYYLSEGQTPGVMITIWLLTPKGVRVNR